MKPTVFIATPISGFVDESDYAKFRTKMKTLVRRISKKANVISEILDVHDVSTYESPALSVERDLENIEVSTHFVLIYPQKSPTSALVELGYALARRKKILILTLNQDTLPYMLKKLDNVYTNVKISYYTDEDWRDVENIIYGFVSK